MRVLHFRETFSSLSETFIYDYYREQVRLGLDTHFATVTRVDEVQRPASNVHVLRLPPKLHPRRVLWQGIGRLQAQPRWQRPYPLYARALREVVDEVRPDIVHAHFGTAGVIAERAIRDTVTPLIVTFYGHDVSQLPRVSGWRALYTALFRRATAVTVLSEHMRKVVHDLGVPPEKVHVVHLARMIQELPFRERVGPVRSWISVGRLTEKKGFDDAIRSFARVAAVVAGAELNIIGDGKLRPQLEQLSEELGCSKSIHFLGARSAADVVRSIDAADALLLCSKTATNGDQEGTPTVLMEAQALGAPCVSTRHAGIPEMLPSSAQWLLASEGNVDEISEVMLRLSQLSGDEVAQLARDGRQHVEGHFSLTEETRKLLSLYQHAASSQAGVR